MLKEKNSKSHTNEEMFLALSELFWARAILSMSMREWTANDQKVNEIFAKLNERQKEDAEALLEKFMEAAAAHEEAKSKQWELEEAVTRLATASRDEK